MKNTQTHFKAIINKVLVFNLVFNLVITSAGMSASAETTHLSEKSRGLEEKVVMLEYGISTEMALGEIKSTVGYLRAELESDSPSGAVINDYLSKIASQLYTLESAVKSSEEGVTEDCKTVLDDVENVVSLFVESESATKAKVALAVVRESLGLKDLNVGNSGSTYTVQNRQANVSFPDMTSEHWAYSDVMACVEHGAINGKPSEGGVIFDPTGQVSLGELLAVLTRLINPNDISAPVEGAHWAQPNYEAAIKADIIRSVDFNPSDLGNTLSREDLAYILVKAAGANGEELKQNNSVINQITDYNTISIHRQSFVAMAYANGLMQGVGGGAFNPSGTVTRAEMATIVSRLMGYRARPQVNTGSGNTAEIPAYIQKLNGDYFIISDDTSQGKLKVDLSRQYELETLSLCRTGKDEGGCYVIFKAPELADVPSEVRDSLVFLFYSEGMTSDWYIATDDAEASLKCGESKKVYYTDGGAPIMNADNIHQLEIRLKIGSYNGGYMFTRSIYNTTPTQVYGKYYHDRLDTTLDFDSSAVWAGLGIARKAVESKKEEVVREPDWTGTTGNNFNQDNRFEARTTAQEFVEGSNHVAPKVGDVVIKADGTRVVLEATKIGNITILGYGANGPQGVDPYTGTANKFKVGHSSWFDLSPFVKDEITGSVFTNNEWVALISTLYPQRVGSYDGEMTNTWYKWNADMGEWFWIGPRPV